MAEHKLERDALEHILSYSYEHSQAAFVSNLPKSHKTETGKGDRDRQRHVLRRQRRPRRQRSSDPERGADHSALPGHRGAEDQER